MKHLYSIIGTDDNMEDTLINETFNREEAIIAATVTAKMIEQDIKFGKSLLTGILEEICGEEPKCQ